MILAISFGILGLLGSYSIQPNWDNAILIDGSYRVFQGRRPHHDFSTPIGPLYFVIGAAGMWLSTPTIAGIFLGIIFLGRLYWAESLGLNDSIGLDLFSCSKYIELGDIHETAFDVIILGWVISYSSRPAELIDGCLRIVKSDGFIGFGIESNPDHRQSKKLIPPRVNILNSCKDISSILEGDIVFIHDPEFNDPSDNAIIFKINK